MILTRHNDFPSYYHPDEPTKVGQVVRADYNFHHPLLLIRSAKWLTGGREVTPHQVVLAGRTASALFTALAIGALALLASTLAPGAPVAATLLAGLLLLTNSIVFELAHYMKEDPSLAFGWAASLLCASLYLAKPTALRAFVLGTACGVAASAKYPGAFLLLPALACAFQPASARPIARRLSDSLCLLTGCAVVFLAINWPMVSDFSTFLHGVERETDFAVSGHKGFTRSVPHGVYWAVFRNSTSPLIWIILAIYFAGVLLSLLPPKATRHLPSFLRSIRPEPVTPAEWIVILSPLLYTIILSFLPKTHYRYFLPVLMVLLTLSAPALARSFPGRFQKAKALIATAAILLSLAPTLRTASGFTRDSRREALQFIATHLPPDAVILQDRKVGLPIDGLPRYAGATAGIPQKIRGDGFAADSGPLNSLRSRGITHVAVAEATYGRFFLTHLKAKNHHHSTPQRLFYQQLFDQGLLLWEKQPGHPKYLQPGIRIYQLPNQIKPQTGD